MAMMSILLDRSTGSLVIMVSTEGGMNIEEVAENHLKNYKRMGWPNGGPAAIPGA